MSVAVCLRCAMTSASDHKGSLRRVWAVRSLCPISSGASRVHPPPHCHHALARKRGGLLAPAADCWCASPMRPSLTQTVLGAGEDDSSHTASHAHARSVTFASASTSISVRVDGSSQTLTGLVALSTSLQLGPGLPPSAPSGSLPISATLGATTLPTSTGAGIRTGGSLGWQLGAAVAGIGAIGAAAL